MSIISSQSADNFWFCKHFDEGKVCESSRLAISEKNCTVYGPQSQSTGGNFFFQLNLEVDSHFPLGAEARGVEIPNVQQG